MTINRYLCVICLTIKLIQEHRVLCKAFDWADISRSYQEKPPPSSSALKEFSTTFGNKDEKVDSPNDASAIVSFEKLEKEMISLNGALDISLLIDELTPFSSASNDINRELKKARPRDTTIPSAR